ncbi:MAG: hypothetical protein GW941_00940 [Candidatus Pacebacteria bacterium]|nr:hypothetical protein [Candidatus Paceibacterota bacterium]
MNWKIVLAGSFIITTLFLIFVGFQVIQSRNNQADIVPVDINSGTAQFNRASNQEKAAIRLEGTVHRQLIRGRVSSYNQAQDTFSIAMELREGSEINVQGLVDINIDKDRINEFSCWPEFNNLPDGTQIDMKNTFIPMRPGSFLYLEGEEKVNITDIDKYFVQSPYVFAYLSSPIEDLNSVADGTQIDFLNLEQLAILGCNEN